MTAHQVGLLLLGLAAIIALARLLGAAAKKIGQPAVVGEIVAGILIGPTLFGTVVTDRLLPVDVRPALSGLANVGLVLFMFIVGYELDHTLVRGRGRIAVSVSVGSVILPLGLGAGLGVWLADRHGVTDVVPFALFIGAAMAVTAFPVLARILTERGMHRTEVGSLTLASAAVDDVIAWTLLAGVVALAGATADGSWHILLAVPFAAAMFLLVRPALRRLVAARTAAGRLTPDILAIVLIGVLASAYAAEWLGVHAIFGAFLFGAMMPDDRILRGEIMERLEQVSVLLLLPAFFVLAGIRVDLSGLGGSGWLELALILAVAIGGKFAGAYLGARVHGVRHDRSAAMAILMNTRGLTEIVILTVGLQLGLLDGALYSLMVVMALVTTAMAGPLLSLVYPRARVDRDIAEAERKAVGGPAAYRVLVQMPTDELVARAAKVIGPRRPAEVVLSRLLTYGPAVEVGAGLTTELLEVTTAMSELAELARPLTEQGISAPILVRFSKDPAADFARQAESLGPDAVVTA
ncbi:MAG: cation/H(+) antiporter [Hamadaea sp.]|nr:cation/H(+) antiporter [Hamadaea sp.]